MFRTPAAYSQLPQHGQYCQLTEHWQHGQLHAADSGSPRALSWIVHLRALSTGTYLCWRRRTRLGQHWFTSAGHPLPRTPPPPRPAVGDKACTAPPHRARAATPYRGHGADEAATRSPPPPLPSRPPLPYPPRPPARSPSPLSPFTPHPPPTRYNAPPHHATPIHKPLPAARREGQSTRMKKKKPVIHTNGGAGAQPAASQRPARPAATQVPRRWRQRARHGIIARGWGAVAVKHAVRGKTLGGGDRRLAGRPDDLGGERCATPPAAGDGNRGNAARRWHR